MSTPRQSRRIIPQQALDRQAQSSDPRASVWVAANAGSGKTHVLTERVIRLLLQGSAPSRILCLTYTKAAAAVMQTRIFNRLAEWTQLDDSALAAELRKLEGKVATAARVSMARTLFARALETPGGLKIQTIHAFCESLLHQFPLEANIAGHFDMINDMQQADLLAEAKRLVLEKVWHQTGTPLADAFESVLTEAGEKGFEDLMAEAVANRQKLAPCIKHFRHHGQQLFYELFQLDPQDNAATLTQRLRETALFDNDVLARLARHGGANAAKFADALAELRAAEEPAQISALCEKAYFTKDKQSKKLKPRDLEKICVKAVQKVMPDILDMLTVRQQQLAIMFDQLKKLELVRLNSAAYLLIDALLAHYDGLKRARGLLDFDDLISHTLAMLKRAGAGRWVQYKLDSGIDHILVDEAQDTSPAQWEIVRLLSDEFFAGAGQRNVERTIFAVGDEKQSIYSFQGAVPEDFAANGRLVAQRAVAAEKTFRKVRLDFSFRSTGDVLSAVDQVFSTAENYEGLSAENEPTVHDAVRVHEPGLVDIWEVLSPETVEEPEDWREPVDHLAAPAIRLAEQIAQTIADWLHNGKILTGKQRAMRASDIMVLVRKRGQFVHALSRALKNRGVAVAGADRLHLAEHIATRDLMALGQFVLQPRDDLSLASVLKSPLFGLGEDDLLSLAAGRSATLISALEDAAADDENLSAVVYELRSYRAIADSMPVFEFYSRVLSQNGGRRKILARLGSEAGDVLDAFLDYTLAIQQTGLPGLQAFLETLKAANPEIKRELDQNRDEVRIMTVHAAKGLEGAVVFLVDSGSKIWVSNHTPKLLPMAYKQDSMLVWQPNAALKTQQSEQVVQELKRRTEQEYRRLLYVGMTRAEDWLIVCGYRGKQGVGDSWLPVVQKALAGAAVPVEPPVGAERAWRYVIPRQEEMPLVQGIVHDTPAALPPMPDFLRRAAAAEHGLPRPLAPSGLSVIIEDDAAADPEHMRRSPVLEDTAGASLSFAVERGNIVHKLMQYLPDVALADRHSRAAAYMQHALPHWTDMQRQEALAGVFSVLERADIAPLFGAKSKAEVAVTGIIAIHGRERAVSGRIDRLALVEDKVLLADFKTGRPPQNVDEIPVAYLLQMALYQQLLQQVYPDREIYPLLIYTQEALVFAPDGKGLAALLAKLAQPNL